MPRVAVLATACVVALAACGPDGRSIVFTQVAGATAPRRIAFVAPDGSGLRVLDDQAGFMARLQP